MEEFQSRHFVHFDSSWSDEAQTVLCRSMDFHGGYRVWERLERLSIRLHKLTGSVPRAKGFGHSFDKPNYCHIFPKEEKVVFFYANERRLTYQSGAVKEDGAYFSRTVTRKSFSGRTLEKWDDLMACYFFGYALLNYLSYPFLLCDFRVVAEKYWKVAGAPETAAKISLQFPADYSTHCPIQHFYFNPYGFLFRIDYAAHICGPLVQGANYAKDITNIEGLRIPLSRTVFPKYGPLLIPLNGLSATYELIDSNIISPRKISLPSD